MKRVLIVAYYWPPSGGSGVQRWLKTVKYIRQFGWEPVVVTPLNPQFEQKDFDLEKEIPEGVQVIRVPIWEPFEIYNKLVGKKNSRVVNPIYQKKGLKNKLIGWVRANVFIPDSRMFWIKPAAERICTLLKEEHFDAMVTTGPPHSMHVIGLKVKEKIPAIPWLADFRDPWTQIGFYKELDLSSSADKKHKKLELKVLTQAEAVCAISDSMAEDLKEIHRRSYAVVHNGYDEADFNNHENQSFTLDEKFSIFYAGMWGKPRNHIELWQVLGELVKESSAFADRFQLNAIGVIDPVVKESVKEFGLEKHVQFGDYMPHKEVLKLGAKTQLALLLIDNRNNAGGILTGKVFELLAQKRPILCIGPKGGDIERIISEAGAGYFSGFGDSETLKANILDAFSRYQQGDLNASPSGIEKYSRRNLAGKLAGILDSISKK